MTDQGPSTASSGLRISVALLLCLGCRAATSSSPDARVAEADVAGPPVAVAGQTTATPSEAELGAFLAHWVDVQNRGDYEGYAALYASKLVGIKRVGKREARFTRAGWLEDRRRMFQKPMTVAAREPVIQAAANSAQLSFVQHFASGNFADVGEKRLLVVREAGALRIAHEELLASRAVPLESPTPQTELDLHFLLRLESGLYMALPELREPAATGAPRLERELEADHAIWTTTRALRDVDLGPSTVALRGQRVRLDDGCVAQVSGFVLMSRVVPHFGTVQAWENRLEDQPGGALTPEQSAAQAYELGSKQVAAKLSGCNSGTYAQREATAAPEPAETVRDERLERLGRAAFARLPEVAADQRSYLREVADAQGSWWAPSLEVDVFRHPRSRQTLVSVRAQLVGDGCADFSAQQWAVFELRGKRLVLLQVVSSPARLPAVLDVNHDGRLGFLVEGEAFGTDIALRSPDPNGPGLALEYSFQDCPC